MICWEKRKIFLISFYIKNNQIRDYYIQLVKKDQRYLTRNIPAFVNYYVRNLLIPKTLGLKKEELVKLQKENIKFLIHDCNNELEIYLKSKQYKAKKTNSYCRCT